MLKNKSKLKVKKSRQEINEASRELKRKRKHKGLPSGSRFNSDDSNNKKLTIPVKDARIGSKKKIVLIKDEPAVTIKKVANVNHVKQSKLTPEQELEKLESDPKLEMLLDLIEQETELTQVQQTYLDTKLQRIDDLMKELGYLDEEFDDIDDDEEDDKKEDIVGLLKRK